MAIHKRCIAMLLAGGQGSRLGILTQNKAKPAVPFGGKYRIIDFPLSNCTNSDIDIVGVLTQYQPLELNAYIGTGRPWDLDRMQGGVFVLPPFQTSEGSEWYKGTANAIAQNMAFIEHYTPEYVLILSGDHIYKMNYDKMLRAHIQKKADCTIAVLEVPWSEASRFGIMNTDADDRIVEFEEKPAAPKSNLASMGVYIFTWEKLRAALLSDEADTASQKDFGKNVIPKALASDWAMYAYPFQGYWKDVGTIESLWEANMDLLRDPPVFDLYDTAWRIYNRNPVQPPHFVASGARVEQSMITEGTYVAGTVRGSVLFAGVRVETGAEVVDSVIMPGARIMAGARVVRAIVSENAVVGPHSRVGEPSGLIAVIGDNTTLPEGSLVGAGEQIDRATAAARLSYAQERKEQEGSV